MKTYSNDIINNVNKVINDFKGDKAAALRHFEADHSVWTLFGFGYDEQEDKDCAEYLRSIM